MYHCKKESVLKRLFLRWINLGEREGKKIGWVSVCLIVCLIVKISMCLSAVFTAAFLGEILGRGIGRGGRCNLEQSIFESKLKEIQKNF